MKKRVILIVSAVLLFVIALCAVGKLLLTQRIDQQVEATVYRDGEIVGKTTVLMQGKRVRYPFLENSFVGEFRVPWVEETDVDGLQAKIEWNNDHHVQTIRYSYRGELLGVNERGIAYFLLISDGMEEFALMTTQGDVIATSPEAYQLCAGHISTDGGSRSSVDDIDGIPALN